MSNWIVPSANPNTPNDIDSITAATPNVKITGTGLNPLIGVTQGGVLSVENVTNAVNLIGVGMTIAATPPDVTLTSAVQNIVATGSGCSVIQSPAGTFTINFS